MCCLCVVCRLLTVVCGLWLVVYVLFEVCCLFFCGLFVDCSWWFVVCGLSFFCLLIVVCGASFDVLVLLFFFS